MDKKQHILLLLLLVPALTGCETNGSQFTGTPSPTTSIADIVSAPTATSTAPASPTPPTPTASAVKPEPSFTATPSPTEVPTLTATATPPTIVTEEGVAALAPPYDYLKLEELPSDVELQYVAWEADGLGLVYALTRLEARSVEPKDWAWWRYDLETGQKEPLPPPESRVTQEVRRQLDLCPYNQEPLVTRPACPGRSILFESPFSERIAFSPSTLHEEGATWLGNNDGTDLVQLESLPAPAYVHWSPDGQWLIIGDSFPGMPGQMATHYLARTDGSFVVNLIQFTGHDMFAIEGLYPEFSPDGRYLAYIGSEVFDSLDESDYKLRVLDLETLESHKVADRSGLFQWPADSSGLYVLDGTMNQMGGKGPDFSERKVALHFIDITAQPPREELIAQDIPFDPRNYYDQRLGVYSPLAQALAYVGHGRQEFGLLLLAPNQSDR